MKIKKESLLVVPFVEGSTIKTIPHKYFYTNTLKLILKLNYLKLLFFLVFKKLSSY